MAQASSVADVAGAAELCNIIWQVDDPTSAVIAAIARHAATRFVGDVGLVLDTIDSVALEAKESGNDAQLASMWALVDQLSKAHEAFTEAVRPRLVRFAESFPVPRSSAHFARFAQILEGFKSIFGVAVMSVISIKLRDVLGVSGLTTGGGAPDNRPTTAPNAAALREEADSAAAAAAKQMQLSTMVRTIGGYQIQRANNGRPAGAQHALQVKTRDSLQAIRGNALYAPALPSEMTIAMPERDADAPVGYMQALPANHQQEYIDNRKRRLREIMEKKRKQEEEGRNRGQPGAAAPGDVAPAAVDLYEDVVMPAELPRDEFGVKIGNFPAGVRFLRNAIAQCGGALELSLLEERVSQMSDREAQAEFGNLRQFLHIHSPTFRVVGENDKWIVRLATDPDPDTSKAYSWESVECPLCSFLCKGRNLAKHMNNRKCIDVQLAKGLAGRPDGPIGDLAYAARTILDHSAEQSLDDDDVSFFASCVRAAGTVPRFKYASTTRFAPILKALRVVRDAWLDGKGVKEMAEAPVTPEDGPYASLFAAFGEQLRRLPISWLDSGDIIDMARRFSEELLQPHPPIPRAGDPRIRVGNLYSGMMFAESDSDGADVLSSEDEEFSDDEAALFEFAPPVSVMETMMAVGNARETKKINFRLRTAPPVPAAAAIQSDGTKTVAQLYKR